MDGRRVEAPARGRVARAVREGEGQLAAAGRGVVGKGNRGVPPQVASLALGGTKSDTGLAFFDALHAAPRSGRNDGDSANATA